MRFPIAAILLASAPLTQRGFSDPAAELVRVADNNFDGDVTAAEWAAFVTSLGAGEDGVLDRHSVLAKLVVQDLDQNAEITRADIELALDGGRSRSAFFMKALADADASGDVSEEEQAAFLAAAGDDVSVEKQKEWVKQIEALPPPPVDNRGAMVPPVVLAGYLPALDADANGRLTLDDLNARHRGFDTNGDSVVTAAELQPQSTGPPSGFSWNVSEEERRRSPLMPWQRTLEDALALVQATGKPLLICVNMDGEAASESLAFTRYRDPEFAALVAGFVPVVASPDRRETRERDDQGRRLPDRRFGRLINSEHIDIEPMLFERYFNNNRVAPRHVGVSAEGEILFDLFLLQDLSIIDAKLREFGVQTDPPADPASLTNEQLLESPDALHRDALEQRFLEADEATRLKLTEQALSKTRATQHPELIRLALRDLKDPVREAGAVGVAIAVSRDITPSLMDQVPAALAIAGENDLLRAAILRSLAHAVDTGEEGSQRTKDAGFYLRSLSRANSPAIDVRRWQLVLAGAKPNPAVDVDTDYVHLERLDDELTKTPNDVLLLQRRAEWLRVFARIQLAGGGNPTFMLGDTISACEDVLALSPSHPRAMAILAWAKYMTNDAEEAADLAVNALPELVWTDAATPLAADVLGALANIRTRGIYTAMGAGEEWPIEWTQQARCGYEAWLAHPDSTEDQWIAYLDLLGSLRNFGAQAEIIRRGLEWNPTSERLHSLSALPDVARCGRE